MDLDMRPVEGINGESRTEEILAILKSYGISKDGGGTVGNRHATARILME